MPGVLCVFLLAALWGLVRLIRSIVLVAIVITIAAFLYVFLMFWIKLVRLIALVIDLTTCTVLFAISGISWMYVLKDSSSVKINIAIAISVCRNIGTVASVSVISRFLSLSMIVLKGVLQQKLQVLVVVKCWLYLV